MLEDIRVRGNQRMPVSAIERYLGLHRGDEIDADAINAARTQLVASGYFKSVDLSTRPGSERGDIILFVDVDEHSNPIFETGFGYHDLNGWYLTLVGLRLDNVLGSDSQTRIGARLGFRLAGVDAEWRKTVSSDGRVGLGVKLFGYSTQHRFFGSGPNVTDANDNPTPWAGPDWNGYDQVINRGGSEAVIHYRLDDFRRIELGVRGERITPDSTFEDTDKNELVGLPPELLAQNEEATITSLVLRAVHDSRNDAVYPTAGSFARVTVDVSNTTAGNGSRFLRATGDIREHVHVRNGWVLSSHLSGGITSRETPYYNRFYIGGNYSIRGFEEWSLSETDGDDGFWTFNQELRWPLVGRFNRHPRLVGLVFVDVGQGWRHGEELSTSDIESGAGYGVRLSLPWLGTLGLDVGVPISEGRTGDRFRAHLSLGFSF